MRRRDFAGLVAGAFGGVALGNRAGRGGMTEAAPDPCALPDPIRRLEPLTHGIVPISDEERRGRIERARRLMTEAGISALLMEPGSSLYYFTGVRWSLSERPFLLVIPADGELAYVCPAFEEARARERLRFSGDLRVWQEDESPYRLAADILRDRRIAGGRIGVEEQLRFFVLDGVRRAAPSLEYVSADQVTAGCRMIKSPAELALMQRANDITIAAFRVAFATLQEGMTQYQLMDRMTAALERVGGSDPWVLVGFGEYSAYPHGSLAPQRLRRGDIVLMDAGCAVEGYQSDITRTTVFGKPTPRQIEIWNLERRAQDAAFAAARPGAICESVDAAARRVITSAGFGPGYRVPGLPHRTGHGIGLDGHEWTYLVRGNTTPLAPGMCFSDEPTIAIYGEFGIRLEDCMYITETGARFFTAQSPAIDQPFG